MAVEAAMQPSKVLWGELEEDDGEDLDFLLLPIRRKMVQCLTYRKRHSYATKSNQHRIVKHPEYNVRSCSNNDKNYFIGRFVTGLPTFKKKNENKWSLQKEGLQGRQVSDALRDKHKNKHWLLEDETGQSQYHGQLDGSQSATY